MDGVSDAPGAADAARTGPEAPPSTPTAVADGSPLVETSKLAAVLVSTMVSTAFQIFVLAVLASRFIEDFGLSRFEIGLIGSLNTAVGALTAPTTGRITDRIGARQAAIVAQVIVTVGFSIMALADSTAMLVLSAVVLGLPQGWGNPATNALIAERVAPGARGVITGIKQSGVQLAIFLSGLTLPAMASAMGWQNAMWIYAALFAVFAIWPLALPATPPDLADVSAVAPTQGQHLLSIDTVGVRLIAFYAFLMGTGGGAISRFLALFAEEEAGMSNTTAGMVVALTGVSGMATRVIAGRVAERQVPPLQLLSWLAVAAVGVAVLLMVTLAVGSWLLWPVALLFSVGHAAWNAVAMLAIIMGVDPADAGRASGTAMFGFLGGLAVGAPVAGLAIDTTGSYQTLWIGSLVLAAVSSLVARAAHARQA